MSEDRQNSNPRQPNRGNGNGDPKMPPVPKFKLNWLYIIIGVALIVLWLNGGNGGAAVKEVAYDPQFKQYISEGYASRLVVYDDRTLNMYIKPSFVKEVYGPMLPRWDPILT